MIRFKSHVPAVTAAILLISQAAYAQIPPGQPAAAEPTQTRPAAVQAQQPAQITPGGAVLDDDYIEKVIEGRIQNYDNSALERETFRRMRLMKTLTDLRRQELEYNDLNAKINKLKDTPDRVQRDVAAQIAPGQKRGTTAAAGAQPAAVTAAPIQIPVASYSVRWIRGMLDDVSAQLMMDGKVLPMPVKAGAILENGDVVKDIAVDHVVIKTKAGATLKAWPQSIVTNDILATTPGPRTLPAGIPLPVNGR